MLRWATQIHKWLGLVVGLQVLGWVLGGLVMTAIPIERVRSEHRIAHYQAALLPEAGLLDAHQAQAAAGVGAVEATLKSTLRGNVWVLKDADGKSHVVDAATGRHMAAMGEGEVRQLAGALYEGPGRPVAVRYFQAAPREAGKDGPLWRVDFNDREGTSFYMSPDTAEVVSRRSNVWRLYDVFWRIHILDFATGDDFNNPLVIAMAALALPMTLAGLVLLWIRLRRDWIGARAKARREA